MSHALTLLPDVNSTLLTKVYADAFRKLMYVLITITLLSALIVFGILGRSPEATKKLPGSEI